MKLSIPVAIILGVLVVGLLLSIYSAGDSLGSVSVTDEYKATTTAASTVYGSTITGDSIIRTGAGAFGSVVITGADTGVINFYDATTTDVNKRTGNKASSTIHLASFPASAAAGTYTFDLEFSDGLYVDIVEGSMPTTTITYRSR